MREIIDLINDKFKPKYKIPYCAEEELKEVLQMFIDDEIEYLKYENKKLKDEVDSLEERIGDIERQHWWI